MAVLNLTALPFLIPIAYNGLVLRYIADPFWVEYDLPGQHGRALYF
jgi:hypothetical protein